MPEKARVIIYTKPGCHLCVEAKAEILAAGCGDFFELEEVNIETDPALRELYALQIPVITINGREAFKYRLTSAAFKKAVRG